MSIITEHPVFTRVIQGDIPDINTLISELGNTFDLLHLLADTRQDSKWHAEGDVRLHTAMTLLEISKLLKGDAAHLSPERRLALVLSALFHDIGKPLVTRIRKSDGRIVVTNHSIRGASHIANKLMGLPLPYEVVQHILSLVAHHHIPIRLVRRNASERTYRKFARLADSELLFFLSLADMRGRTCMDQKKQIETVETFRKHAKQHGVWGVSDPYGDWRQFFETELANFDKDAHGLVLGNAIRDAEAGRISTPEEALTKSCAYRDAFPRLVIMCGPSGAGKSSWIRKNIPEYHAVSLDDLREKIAGKRADQSKNDQVVRAARDALKEHLSNCHKVVWDATNLRREYRDAISRLGFKYHALVTLVVFHQPEQVFFARNREREHAVPEEVLQQQMAILEWPDASEAHRIFFIGEKCLNPDERIKGFP
ncbi:MAG: hypothetical protein B6245_12180 [Desulfobacteraceae bacterium 4572_88]|nr:MAG: hypothetical protein B6245_12180 [Desulfobacteraceae bacterium 4572_88]